MVAQQFLMRHIIQKSLLLIIAFGAFGCATLTPEQKSQREKISREPSGDYWVGRRFHWLGTRVWGYVRRPGRPWDSAKLVVLDERSKKQPDRISEIPRLGRAHGFDHNYEYKLWGNMTSMKAYDPNGNREIPMFRLQRYQLISKTPGFIFKPGDTYNQRKLPREY